jgi:hypothetical protein
MAGPAWPGQSPPGGTGRRRGRSKPSDWPIFQAVLQGLRKLVPTAFPVTVRRAAVRAGVLGTCHRSDDRFVIRLATWLDQEQAIETLLHEWAHALAWSHSLDRLVQSPEVTQAELERLSHDGAWGLAYSRVWQVYGAEIMPRLNAREG